MESMFAISRNLDRLEKGADTRFDTERERDEEKTLPL